MLSFLFWNLMKLPRAELVAKAAHEHQADIVVLAECMATDSEVLHALVEMTGRRFIKPEAISGKVRVFSSLPVESVRPVADDFTGRVTIRRVILQHTDFLLVAAHLPSKVNRSDSDQLQTAQRMAVRIRDAEREFDHRRTVLIGDLNMNPFEAGVVAAHGLHGVMTRQIANERTRIVDGEEHPFFYNPMWGLLGDRTPGPPGTYYRRLGRPTEYFWNTFDQVLIRPDLLDAFDGNVIVVTQIDHQNLLTVNGFPDKQAGSDHLPLVFRLALN